MSFVFYAKSIIEKEYYISILVIWGMTSLTCNFFLIGNVSRVVISKLYLRGTGTFLFRSKRSLQ